MNIQDFDEASNHPTGRRGPTTEFIIRVEINRTSLGSEDCRKVYAVSKTLKPNTYVDTSIVQNIADSILQSAEDVIKRKLREEGSCAK